MTPLFRAAFGNDVWAVAEVGSGYLTGFNVDGLQGGVFGVLALDLRDLRPDLGPGERLELVCPIESFEFDRYRRAEFELGSAY